MSAFAGVLRFDGGRSTPDDFRRAFPLSPLANLNDGAFAVAWTPDAAFTIARSLSGGVLCAGRIDNGVDVARAFALADTAEPATILAAAFSRRGLAGLAEAVGDFVGASWDPHALQLTLFSDAIGGRPLFYAAMPNAVWFASSPKLLCAARGAEFPINESYLAEYLTGFISTVTETAFTGVHLVEPGTVVTFSASRPGMPTAARFWTPPAAEMSRSADDELTDEFMYLLTRAVMDATRGGGMFGVQASGGLDSSALLAIAAQLPGVTPLAFSLVYPGFTSDAAGELVDESAFIDAIVAHTGAQSVRIDPRGASRDQLLRFIADYGDLPDVPMSDAITLPLNRAAMNAGCRAMLTGFGGDMWLTGTIGRLPLLLRKGDWREAAAFARQALQTDQLGATPRALVLRVAAAFLPDAVKSRVRNAIAAPVMAPWITQEFIRSSRFEERRHAWFDTIPATDDPVVRESLMRFFSPAILHGRYTTIRAGSAAGIDVRHPFCDRRLVDFMMRLPDDLRFRDGQSRFILRRALGDRLPPPIAERTSKGDAQWQYAAAVRGVLGGAPPSRWRMAERGWIDADRLNRAVIAMLGEPAEHRVPLASDGDVWQAVAAEAWLAAIDDGRTT